MKEEAAAYFRALHLRLTQRTGLAKADDIEAAAEACLMLAIISEEAPATYWHARHEAKKMTTEKR